MFAAVVVLHLSIQQLLRWKTRDEKDGFLDRNNSGKNREAEPVSESFEELKVSTINAVPSHAPESVSSSSTVPSYAPDSLFGSTGPSHSPDCVYWWEKLPFLSDSDTVKFLKKSNVMFIMRGLPGSGKSTLVKQIQQTYPEAVVCSADHFFTDSEGNYNYDAAKISEAHSECQKKATESCINGQRVIIIDNTNIQAWTMAHYLGLAQFSHYYHCLILEPKTPWRYDVDELALRNTHMVNKEYISKKVKLIRDQKFLPMYYGWFLTRKDSTMLVSLSRKILEQCSEALPEGITIENGINKRPADILNSLDEKYTLPRPMLHCTAVFLGHNSKSSYHDSEIVQQSIGKKFSIQVTGFVYTERTVSAIIDLKSMTERNQDVKLQLFEKLEEDVYREKHRNDKSRNNSEKYFQHGCSAHVTIAFCKGGQSKFSGDDILEMCEMNYFGKFVSLRQEFGFLTAYYRNMYRVDLQEPVTLDCLFQGFYSTRGHR